MTAQGLSRKLRPEIGVVHGARHGGWCWDGVAGALAKQGIATHAPTLTGAEPNYDRSAPVPTLSTHVLDVVAPFEANDIGDAVLVGRSYGGMVIAGAADRLRERVRHVICLDAALPADGQSMITDVA